MFKAMLDNVILFDKNIQLSVIFTNEKDREYAKFYVFPVGKGVDTDSLKKEVGVELNILNDNEKYIEELKLKIGQEVQNI